MNISPGFCTVGLLYPVYCFEEEKHTSIKKIFGDKEKIRKLRKIIIFSELLLSYPTTNS